MNYQSTRGLAPTLRFSDILLGGLASDGGLYVPESYPRFSADELAAIARHELPRTGVRGAVAPDRRHPA